MLTARDGVCENVLKPNLRCFWFVSQEAAKTKRKCENDVNVSNTHT